MGIPAGAGVGASGQPPFNDWANGVLTGTIAGVGPSQPFAFRGMVNLVLWASLNTPLTTAAGSLAATVVSATGLAVGNAINSVNVPKGTTIGALVGTAVTLALPPLTYTGQIQTGFASIIGLPSVAVAASLVGATVTGPGIPSGTTVLSAAGTGLTLSAVTTALPANTPGPAWFTFAPTGNAITATGADANATFTGAAINFVGTINLERSFDGGSTFTVCNFGTGGAPAQFSGPPISITYSEPERGVLYRLNTIAYTSGTIRYRISQTGGAAESLAISGV